MTGEWFPRTPHPMGPNFAPDRDSAGRFRTDNMLIILGRLCKHFIGHDMALTMTSHLKAAEPLDCMIVHKVLVHPSRQPCHVLI